jgi:hypothetical protein
MAEPEAPVRPVETAGAPVLRAPAASPPREIVVEIPAPSRTEIREYVVVEKHTPEPAAPYEAMPLPLPHHEASYPEPDIAAVRVGQPETPSPREKRLPTLAEVRAWTAQPVLQAAEPPVAKPSPSRPPAVSRVADAPPLAIDARENYSLEIGTIQILIDGPAEPAPKRSAMAARPSEPAQLAWSRASRHYLRR